MFFEKSLQKSPNSVTNIKFRELNYFGQVILDSDPIYIDIYWYLHTW